MKDDFKKILSMYDLCNSKKQRNMPLWRDISRFVGINVNPDEIMNPQSADMGQDKDQYVDDPTSAISVNQFGDYLVGIMWGSGKEAFDLVPSRYVLELVDPEDVKEYFDYATAQVLYHMNHVDAGFAGTIFPYAYDQGAFGFSGIGTFLNKGFVNKMDDNALVFRSFGVDNVCAEEGKNGQHEIVFAEYNWTVSQIVNEFSGEDGGVTNASINILPPKIVKAYQAGKLTERFVIILGIIPRQDYDPKLQGKRGARYRGVWFTKSEGIFFEEDFPTKPITLGRMIKVRGETYGRSSGTMLMSSIRSTNFMVSRVVEVVDKMSNPSLGIFSNALFGDSALDTSAEGLTVFNSSMAAGNNPIFPIHDVGDPSAIIKFLIPYMNEKITSAFKIDMMLDFNTNANMTATETLQRSNIRSRSMSGIVNQQKPVIEHTVRRSVSLLAGINELGVDPRTNDAKIAQKAGKNNRVIPESVITVIGNGRPWYEIKFNTEMERMMDNEKVQRLIQLIQTVGAIASLYPSIVQAIDWYKMLKDINNTLDKNNQFVISAEKFKEAVAAQAQMQQQAMQQQAQGTQAQIGKVVSETQKNARTNVGQ